MTPRARARSASAVVGAVFALTLALAPRRLLTFDEAYYLAAGRDLLAGRWTLPDHPPLLPALLGLADRLPLPLELRVRLVSASLAAATAALTGRLAETLGADARRATWLASIGVLPFAIGLVATPDAPLLAGVALLLLGAARDHRGLAFAGAALATLAKVSGGFVAGLVALELLARHRRPSAVAVLAGAAVAAPFAVRSLVLQMGHVLGVGPLVSAPYLGGPVAVAIWALGALALLGPTLLLRARALVVPGGRALVAGLLVALATSAIVSGRPPEVGWIAPALPVLVVAGARARWSKAALAVYGAPTLVGLGLWLAPGGPLDARAPTHPPFDAAAPAYGRAAWARIYGHNPK